MMDFQCLTYTFGNQSTNSNRQNNKIIFMKLILIFSLAICFIFCIQEKKPKNPAFLSVENNDTIIIKQKNTLNKSYEVGFISKSYSYFWLVGKDTLDFSVNITEFEKDSTLHLSINHRKPFTFTSSLTKINECLPYVREDFNLIKLKSLFFNNPFFYLDLGKELSIAYENQFERKNISYEKLNQFLLKSNLNKQLDNFVSPLNKKIIKYSIEKFHLTDKKHIGNGLPNVDLADYPEFVMNGMGLYMQLENIR